MAFYVLFVLTALVLIGLIGLIWQAWSNYTQVSPEDEAFERNIASLNDAQANRVSDHQLRRTIDTDTGWQIMVQRGMADQKRRREHRQPRKPRR
jgi:hypothetical protein